jgi:hypothetical protein
LAERGEVLLIVMDQAAGAQSDTAGTALENLMEALSQ